MDDTRDTGPGEAQEDGGNGGGRLVPLAHRRSEETDLFARPGADPVTVAGELLERGAHLVNTLVGDVAGLQADQEKERRRIEQEWVEAQELAEQAREKLALLEFHAREVAAKKARLDDLEAPLAAPLDLDPDLPLERLLALIEEEIRLSSGITGAIRFPIIGALLRFASDRVASMVGAAESARARHLAETEHEVSKEGKEALASYEIGLGVLKRDLSAFDQQAPPAARTWSSPCWAGWTPPTVPDGFVRFGTLSHEDLIGCAIPAVLAVPGTRGLGFDPGKDRDAAVEGVRALLARIVASLPAGAVSFTFVDPTGLGESVAPFLTLGTYDERFLEGGVLTGPMEIEERLVELTHHVESVIQQYLQGRYATLAEANAAAGEILEPYRFVVVFDYPAEFTDRGHQLLRGLAENGPRCGVQVIVVTESPVARAHVAKVNGLLGVLDVVRPGEDGSLALTVPEAGTWSFAFDRLPDPSLTASDGSLTLFGRLLTGAGEAARRAAGAAVPPGRVFAWLADLSLMRARADLPVLSGAVDPDDPGTWWRADGATGLGTAIGRVSAKEPALLWFDDTVGTALVAGRVGSASDQLVLDAVTGLTLLYPPDALELYLVDLAGRAGFADLADYGLTHAWAVAADAEREYALEALHQVVDEVAARADRAATLRVEHAGYAALRDAIDEPLPRLLAVISGVERLFAVDDEITTAALEALAAIDRDAPEVGVHVLLAGEDLGAAVPAARDRLAGVRERILVDLTGAELDRFLGPERAGTGSVLRPGEPVRIAAGSLADAPPVPFTPIHFGERARAGFFVGMTVRAAGAGHTRSPEVVAPPQVATLADAPLARLGRGRREPDAPLELWLGEPAVPGPPTAAVLRRADGANLLLVAEQPELGEGMLVATVVSALADRGPEVDVRILDLQPEGEGIGPLLASLADRFTLTVGRRADVEEMLLAVRAEIERRAGAGGAGAPPVLLVLDGLGRARDFDARPDEPPDPDAFDASRTLERILREGPEVGVHVVGWCDRLASLRRRLPRSARREFALRVTGAVSAEDAMVLVETTYATTLRASQALLWDEEQSRLAKFQPFTRPEPTSLAALVTLMGASSTAGAAAG